MFKQLKLNSMKHIYFLLLCLFLSATTIAQSNITFNLSYTAGQAMYVKGTFNGWGNDNQLTEVAPGEYSVTLPLNDGVYEYKFANADWSVQDDMTPGSVCTITNYGNTNRYLKVEGADQILPITALNSCATSGGSFNVTFNIDMSGYTESTLGTVYINGENHNNQGLGSWCGNCIPFTDMGNGIWSATIPLQEYSYQFKFTVDGWSFQEQFLPGDPDTATDGTYTNRYMQADQNKTLNYVWNTAMTLSRQQDDFGFEFKVYPNPTNSVWNIKTTNATINSVDVFDVLGKQVISLETNSNQVAIDATQLPKGLYLAKINSDAGTNSIKLIKN